jgi:uncharacterized protein (DUF58 family)
MSILSSAEAFQHIRRLQIKALHHVNDLFAGIYRSTFKGKGLEFEEVREYSPGDDIRTIDWNVTARSQHPFVKHFREERELTVMLVVDISASSHFGHIERYKSEMIAELAALLAFSAIKNQDKVGLLLFTSDVELYLKPKKGTRHVLRVIRELLYFTPQHQGTDLPKALSFLGRVQRRHVICFLISDFLTDNFSMQASLIAKRHELIAFHVFDTLEKQFSPQALFTLRDLETGMQSVVDTADPLVRQRFEQHAQEQGKKVRQLFESIGADYLAMHTGEPSSVVLQRFFRLRGGRQR